RLGSLEIDRQLVLVRRLHWQIGWLLALEDMVNVTSRAAVLIDNIGSIGDQRRREGNPAIHWLRAQTRRSRIKPPKRTIPTSRKYDKIGIRIDFSDKGTNSPGSIAQRSTR